MRFKAILASLLLLAGVTTASADSQGSVLAQLNARGTTLYTVTNSVNGTNIFYRYIPLLGTNGQLDVSFIPATTGLFQTAWGLVKFVDAANGGDNPVLYDGAITRPYKSLTNAINRNPTNMTYVLAPGVYAAPNITQAGISDITLLGLNPTNTVISGQLKVDNDRNFTLSCYRLTVNEVKQMAYRHLKVGLYDNTIANDLIHRQYPANVNSHLTLIRDPSVSMAYAISTVNSTEILLHNATNVGYTARTPSLWTTYTNLPLNVSDALDSLVSFPHLVAATSNGSILYWQTNQWVTASAGATNQILYGGANPRFANFSIVFTTNSLPYDFVPASDNMYDIGQPSYMWRDGYFGRSIYLNGTNIATLFGGSAGNDMATKTNWAGAVVDGDLSLAMNRLTDVYMIRGEQTFDSSGDAINLELYGGVGLILDRNDGLIFVGTNAGQAFFASSANNFDIGTVSDPWRNGIFQSLYASGTNLGETVASQGAWQNSVSNYVNNMAGKTNWAGAVVDGWLNMRTNGIEGVTAFTPPGGQALTFNVSTNHLVFNNSIAGRKFYPNVDGVSDLGSALYRWQNGYFHYLYGNGSGLTNLNGGAISNWPSYIVTNNGTYSGLTLTNLTVAGTNIGETVAAQGVTQSTVVAWQNSVSNRLTNFWVNPSSATNWTWTNDGTNITLTGYTGPAAVVIPDMLDGLPATILGDSLFAGKAITSISGGANVTLVGMEACLNCTILTSFNLPSATILGISALKGCTALASINFPEVMALSSDALSYCTALTSVYFDQNAPDEASDVYYFTPNVTNYVTSSTATGWGSTWNERPVVRMPVYADTVIASGTNLGNTLASMGLAMMTNGGTYSALTLTNLTAAGNINAGGFGVTNGVFVGDGWGLTNLNISASTVDSTARTAASNAQATANFASNAIALAPIRITDARFFLAGLNLPAQSVRAKFSISQKSDNRCTDLVFLYTNQLYYSVTSTVAGAADTYTNVVGDASGFIINDMYTKPDASSETWQTCSNAAGTVVSWNCSNMVATSIGTTISRVNRLRVPDYYDATGSSNIYCNLAFLTGYTNTVGISLTYWSRTNFFTYTNNIVVSNSQSFVIPYVR